jgi:hypothetical protein
MFISYYKFKETSLQLFLIIFEANFKFNKHTYLDVSFDRLVELRYFLLVI